MPGRLIQPPIRTALMNNPDGTPMTQRAPSNGSPSPGGAPQGSSDGSQLTIQKHWYRYWGDCGDQINANTEKLNDLITSGAHADRPDPAAVAGLPDGALYVEQDRGSIYQLQSGHWQYVAGTMWGTLSPDQRPTDLGVNDAGFDYRTTDQPAREFIWSQGAWIETTPVRFGTHAARLAVNVTRVIEQLLWVETDRTALYQLMVSSGTTPVWQYIAGTMWGTVSPDQRPTDLGTHDAGFDFRGTDQQREFIWSGAAWVEVTPQVPQYNTVQYASGSGFTLTNTAQSVPGAALTLTKAGTYLIHGCFDMSSTNDANNILVGGLNLGGANAFFMTSTTSARAHVSQQWMVSVSAGTAVQLTAWKLSGAGTSTLGGATISALWVSP